jgi:hydroxymethylbilane synthase
LGQEARATETLEAAVSLPAVGQGALGIEARADDEPTRALLAPLHDRETATCVWVERGVMQALEGDCRTPLAAHARRAGDGLVLDAFVAEPDGTRLRRLSRSVEWPTTEAEALRFGIEVGEALKQASA